MTFGLAAGLGLATLAFCGTWVAIVVIERWIHRDIGGDPKP